MKMKEKIEILVGALRTIQADASDARINGLELKETNNDRYIAIERVAIDALVECELEIFN